MSAELTDELLFKAAREAVGEGVKAFLNSSDPEKIVQAQEVAFSIMRVMSLLPQFFTLVGDNRCLQCGAELPTVHAGRRYCHRKDNPACAREHDRIRKRRQRMKKDTQ